MLIDSDKLFRCVTCGKLLTERIIKSEDFRRGRVCLGHSLKQPAAPTFIEKIKIWIGLLK